ncbi:MAG: hypothetical protein AAF495_19345, partial [Pseudomonadota bacterium]
AALALSEERSGCAPKCAACARAYGWMKKKPNGQTITSKNPATWQPAGKCPHERPAPTPILLPM